MPPGHPVPVSGSQAALYHMGKVLPTLRYRQPAQLSCPKVVVALVRHKNKGETKQKIGILSSFLLLVPLLPTTSSAFCTQTPRYSHPASDDRATAVNSVLQGTNFFGSSFECLHFSLTTFLLFHYPPTNKKNLTDDEGKSLMCKCC